MQKANSKFRQAMTIVKPLESAIDLIKQECERRHARFDYDTEIPYGIGVDFFILPAFGRIAKLYPRLERDQTIEKRFSALATVGDIVDLIRTVLNESRDSSCPG